MNVPGRCGKCTTTWTGQNIAHCASCHQTFTGVTAFDKHRHYDKCVDPATRGLTLNEHNRWGRPTDTE